MSHANSTTAAITYAFAANLGIAVIKTAIAAWTGSGSLLAEAIHSYADCGNQALLFIGMKRSARMATPKHPMGFGRESYIWSMMVAITLFSVGGIFSIYEGWLHYAHPQEMNNAEIGLVILSAAALLEAFSLKGAINAMKSERGKRSLWRWFRETHSTELMVVVGEDMAALLGLLIAGAMLGLTLLTGDPVYDAAGSILIGLLLIAVAISIAYEIHSLLLGETDADVRDDVQLFLEQQPCVLRVLNVWAVNHGSNVMIAIKAELLADLTVLQATNVINALEKQIKIMQPRVKWVFFEIDNSD